MQGHAQGAAAGDPAAPPLPGTPSQLPSQPPCRSPAAHLPAQPPTAARRAADWLVPGAVFGAGEGRPPSDRRVLVRGRARSWRTVSVAQRGSGGRCRRGCRRLVDEEARQPSTCGTQTQSVSAGARMGQVRAGRGGASPSSPPNSSLVVVGRLGGQETSVSMVRPMLRRRPGEPLGGASRYRRGTRGRSTDLRGGGEGGRKHVARGQGICERRRRYSRDAWAGVASTSGGHACSLMIVSLGCRPLSVTKLAS